MKTSANPSAGSAGAGAVALAPSVGRNAWLVPLVLYSAGHLLVDSYQGALAVLQPALQERFHLNFAQAGILGGALVCSSSLMQPVYGYLYDRFRSRLFSALGPAIAAVFISSLVWAKGMGGLLALVVLGGTGVAAFHPQAASNAVASIRRNRGRAMAWFICAGAIGLALGPLFFSALLNHGGLEFVRMGAFPGIVVSMLLLLFLPRVAQSAHSRERFDWASLRAVWRPMTILYFLVLIRSIVQITFTQFLPLYLRSERHYSGSAASLSLSLYLVGGAVGGLAGGNLADRFGGRLVILTSMIGSVPFLALFVFGHGAWSQAGLFVGGLILLFTMPVNIVIAQELAPAQAGTVSSLMMGFAFGIAGLVFIPLTGWVADIWSIQVAFAGLIAFPVLGFLLGLKLPRNL